MKLIDSYEPEKAKILYDKGKMMDFLLPINPNSDNDLAALATWQKHLERQGIPYFVIEKYLPNGRNHAKRRVFQLWKKRSI
jgi:hypothetical protein